MAQAEKEIWESTIPGRVAVLVTDDRGRETTDSVLGKGRRLRITAEDRELNEERVRDPQNNPFRNGMLVRVNRVEPAEPAGPDAPPADKPSDNELTDDDLSGLFELESDDFEAAVKALSEVNVRRLLELAKERDAKASQIGFLGNYIQETWPVGGDTPTYREMQARPANAV